MDSFHFQNMKQEKAKKKLKHGSLQKLRALFRLMEVCVFLIILSRSSTILPRAFKFSGEYIKGLFVSLLTPLSVFIIGNIIVIILFLKSGHSSSPPPKKAEATTKASREIDLYDDYVKSRQRNQIVNLPNEENNKQGEIGYNNRQVRRIQRSHSQSENLKKMHSEESCSKLRRSSTEKCLQTAQEMSNEEFKCRVEAFIARQQRLLREEEDFTVCVNVAT